MTNSYHSPFRISGRLFASALLLVTASLQAETYTFTDGQNITTPIIISDGATDSLTIAAGQAEQSGEISGAGAITKDGAGSLILSGDNSYTGGTTLNAGTLRLGGPEMTLADVLGTGILTIKAGTTLGNVATGDVMFGNDSVIEGDFTIDVDGEIIPGGGPNGTDAASGSLENFGNVTLLTDTTITLTGDGLACFGGTITGTNLAVVAQGTTDAHVMFCSNTPNAISGLVRIGTGVTMELWKVGEVISGDEEVPVVAISGDLQIDAGAEVILLNGNQFAATSDVVVDGTLAGASTEINAINDLSGSGIITSDMGDTLAVNSGNFTGTITGDQVILKQNAGTLTLSGTSTYSGGTTITGGTLRAQNNQALGTGRVAVSGGATLRVDAGIRLGNAITIENDGATTYRKDFASGESLTNFSAIRSSGPNLTEAEILFGEASGAYTVESTFDTAPSTPASNDGYRISDVFSLSGTGSDTFVLQLSYTQTAYDAAESTGLYTSELELILGRLANGEWVALGGGEFVAGAWNSSYTTVGTHGVDVANNVVWAVTNQGGEISVVPEPSTWALLGVGVALAVVVGFRRRVS